MDIEVIRAKQDSIARCVGRIHSKADLSYEELLEDRDRLGDCPQHNARTPVRLQHLRA